ncbi:Cytochrome c oxidase assembly protein CtaG [Aquimixticola soesokkakensis]|uniref:Cytochrome c oxidase assembly protein CtaG n=1 Tax=Aquimixticola soesokkakensis TaxID=1519096 RepID=A0A1Y5S8C3_9RHOB|nr:cytochrome c oxidase assembly protein [Aquimixticola soesokkakensis]SLN32122.1 Cytochrome c oxidase assembly protein CtaG [Aquimixticola soesokkakensis]
MSKMDRNTKTLMATLGLVVFMGAMAWAAVPFYSWFCRVTGYGGTTSVSATASDVILDETVKIRFVANTDPDMAWEFRPEQNEMEIRIGETGLAFYEAYNPTDRVIAGTAAYNVAPYEAGGYFTKIECFCFTEQVLQPGERVDMPVTFYVDPEIVKDRDAKFVKRITLSYTFYETDLPDDVASLEADTTGQATNEPVVQ